MMFRIMKLIRWGQTIWKFLLMNKGRGFGVINETLNVAQFITQFTNSKSDDKWVKKQRKRVNEIQKVFDGMTKSMSKDEKIELAEAIKADRKLVPNLDLSIDQSGDIKWNAGIKLF